MLQSVWYFSTLLLLVAGAEIRLYVSPSGSDTNNGLTLSSPLKSIQKAVSRLNDPDVAGSDVNIELTQGYHDLSQSVTLSKNYGHRLTFKAYNGQEVHVTGGKRLGNHLFHPVKDPHVLQTLPTTAHNKVLQLKLTEAGIPLTQLGHLGKFGFGVQRTAPLEVFYNGKPLRLARWPNDGSYKNVITTPDGPRGHRFTYHHSSVGSRAQKWAQEKDLWVYGFWYWDWADESAHVAKVDPSNYMITLSTKLHYGMRPGHITEGAHAGYTSQGAYFNVFNALSELDQQGEYYVDKETGILYVWPPEHNGQVETSDIIYASLINDLFQFSNVSSVTMEDLILEDCRHKAIAGDHLDNVILQRLEIKNTGSYGMTVKSSKHVTIRQCEIHDTDGGIEINGGERKTLTPSGNLVENNHIWSFSRAGAVGQHGISVTGVGAVVQFNHIHEGRYTGIWWMGNDHMIRKNHVHHLCTGASDCGGIHTGRDWTCRGNVIKENHIHHVLRYMPGAQVRGIMLDDQYSSVTIENNVFHDNDLHMNIGGGRDNIVRYNVFYNAMNAAVGVDARGRGKGNSGVLFERLKVGKQFSFKTCTCNCSKC
ncbi:uncharacterized protein LOC135477059 [Liolophura sinensis]|uniref:uncharacterized protein LOC135477059 n=1 Tax=Liolophura sinensis TaxID=3198878 RepID=UPI0031589726